MKKLFVFLGITGLLIVAGWGYWLSIGKAQQWLLFNEGVAESHATSLLKGDIMAVQPVELIDTQISAYPKWVLFSPHNEKHLLILAYAPSEPPEPIASDGALRKWHQIKQSWYELDQP